MKVILTERVKSLGSVGEVVNVSSGYARNFLFPKSLAVVADSSNQRALDHQQRALAKKIEAEKAVATELKKQIDGTVIELTKKVGGNGRLFGTVTANELVKSFTEKGLDVEKRWIVIPTPIKTVGSFDLKVKVFADVEADFQVKVEMDQNQIAELKEKQELAAKRAAAKKEQAAKEEAEAANADEAEEATEETTEA